MSQPLENGASPPGSPDKQVADEEQASQTATIQRIQQYRDDLAEFQLLFAQNELDDSSDERSQHRAYHQLARGFLQLLRPYLTDPDVPRSDYYWQGYTGESLEDARRGDGQILHLGRVTIEPPGVIRQPGQGELERALKQGDRHTIQRADPRNEVDARGYDLVGLIDFADAPAEWTEEWEVMFGPEVTARDLRQRIRDDTVDVQPRQHRNEPITVVKTVRVPREVIDSTVTALENFVRTVGMDVEFEAEPYMAQGEPGL